MVRGFVTGLSAEAVKQRVVARHRLAFLHSIYLQERHVAQAFQEALFDQRAA